jgi:hypothetical protein
MCTIYRNLYIYICVCKLYTASHVKCQVWCSHALLFFADSNRSDPLTRVRIF